MSPLLPPVVASSSKDEVPPPASASASAPPPPPVVASSSESGESASNSEGESASSASSSEDEAPPSVVASTASGSEKDESASGSEKDESASGSEMDESASGSEKDESASGSEKDEARPPHPASAPAPSPPVLAPPPQPALARSSVAASPGSGSTLRKRPHDSTDITTTKRKKVSQIVWSEQDEIELLQAVLNFRNKTGKNPSSHHKEIYDMAQAQGSSFLGGKTYAQFTSKVSVLKKKYVTNNKKISTKAHGLHCWKLCMKIWVSSVGVCDDDWFESSDLLGDITSFGSFDEAYALEKWSLVPLEKKKELQDKWKDVLSHNLQGVKLRSELVSELTSAIHNA